MNISWTKKFKYLVDILDKIKSTRNKANVLVLPIEFLMKLMFIHIAFHVRAKDTHMKSLENSVSKNHCLIKPF